MEERLQQQCALSEAPSERLCNLFTWDLSVWLSAHVFPTPGDTLYSDAESGGWPEFVTCKVGWGLVLNTNLSYSIFTLNTKPHRLTNIKYFKKTTMIQTKYFKERAIKYIDLVLDMTHLDRAICDVPDRGMIKFRLSFSGLLKYNPLGANSWKIIFITRVNSWTQLMGASYNWRCACLVEIDFDLILAWRGLSGFRYSSVQKHCKCFPGEGVHFFVEIFFDIWFCFHWHSTWIGVFWHKYA